MASRSLTRNLRVAAQRQSRTYQQANCQRRRAHCSSLESDRWLFEIKSAREVPLEYLWLQKCSAEKVFVVKSRWSSTWTHPDSLFGILGATQDPIGA
jgi:hypothetical protein